MLCDLFNNETQDADILEIGEGIILNNADGTRISKQASSGKMISYLYEDAKTQVEVIERGCKVSGNGRCIGWRSSNYDYSWLSYLELIKKAKNFGSGLINLGVNLGQSNIIGIYAQNSVEWLVALYGSFYYSSPIIPLYDTLGPDACSYMINHGELRTIVCDKERKVKTLLEKKDDTPSLENIICVSDISDNIRQLGIKKGIKLYTFYDIECIGEMKNVPTNPPKPSDVAEICYTSGTTGNPKGAVLTHGNMVAGVSGLILQMGTVATDKTDTMISYLPLAHVMEQCMEIMIFMNGGSIGFFRGDTTLLIDDMKVLKPSFFPAVPRLLNKLYDKVQSQMNRGKWKIEEMDDIEKEKLKLGIHHVSWESNVLSSFKESLGGKVKLIATAAAPISETVLKFYRQAVGCNVVEIYGQTETTGPATANIVSDTSLGNVGPPIACCMIKLVDVPELGYFTESNTGEMCVKGYNVLKCYYKDPAKTAETIDKDGWMHTGDIATWLPNGSLRIIDRKKHIFKLSQGEYVAPEKLENIYLLSPHISQIIIHGESLQSFLVAIVIPNQDVIMPWCKENSKCSSMVEACKDPAVKQLIFEDMRRRAKEAGLLSFEQVRKIHLHPKLLTLEEGHLTPTLKTKRSICTKYFSKEIQAMYCGKDF